MWPAAKELGAADPNERIRVTLFLRNNRPLIDVGQLGATRPRDRKYLTPAEFSDYYSASPSDVAQVRSFAATLGLEVVDSKPEQRCVELAGKISDVSKAFGVVLKQYDHPLGAFRGRVGPVYLPPELAAVVEGVFGLDNRRAGRPFIRRYANSDTTSNTGAIPPGSYLPAQLAPVYRFPPGDGSGQTVGIFCLNDQGGGYDVEALQEYFQWQNLPVPAITDIVVDGKGNSPDGSDTSVEAMLDIQTAASLAPGARIIMYFGSYYEQGWLRLFSRVVTDTDCPSVISISYGNPETAPTGWTRSGILAVNQVLSAASSRGITICCASGDAGSSDAATPDGTVLLPGVRVQFPASSPYVLGCGGTRLQASDGSIQAEVVWNDLVNPDPATAGFRPSAGGGGISDIFELPAWQQDIAFLNNPPNGHFRGRGVPDVCANAAPETGYAVMIRVFDAQGRKQGTRIVRLGGTSASTPLWAALIARLNENIGNPVGYFNPLLYTQFTVDVLNDITIGNNGDYEASPGWDACTGFGSPDGVRLLHALIGE